MIVTYYGVSCFKVQSGDVVLAFDPFSDAFPAKDFGLKPPRFQTDIVFVSHKHHDDHNGFGRLSGKGDKTTPLLLDGPGDYESQGIYITGTKSFHDEEGGAKLGQNTIYTVNMEGIIICHFGDYGEAKLSGEVKEAVDGVDILFMPINGPSMNPQKAAKLAAQVGPKILIPMHYHKDPKALKVFLDEFGAHEVKPVEKLTLKKKDLAEKKTEVVVLNPVA